MKHKLVNMGLGYTGYVSGVFRNAFVVPRDCSITGHSLLRPFVGLLLRYAKCSRVSSQNLIGLGKTLLDVHLVNYFSVRKSFR